MRFLNYGEGSIKPSSRRLSEIVRNKGVGVQIPPTKHPGQGAFLPISVPNPCQSDLVRRSASLDSPVSSTQRSLSWFAIWLRPNGTTANAATAIAKSIADATALSATAS